ncbi:hypothetical protein [Streptomyces decoyicus]|uniref:hypothetical protein n=1 Tax=Streptomyces decoyicus TaxID=249567 RepID=UPI0033B6E0DE
MQPTRSHIRATAEAYLARHPHERESLTGLLSLLDGPDDPASRATLPGHVTCSAAVIDREQRVLHIGHKVTGLLLAPGGHVEDDRTLLAAAQAPEVALLADCSKQFDVAGLQRLVMGLTSPAR